MLSFYCGGEKTMNKNFLKRKKISRTVIASIFCSFVVLGSMATAIDINKTSGKDFEDIDSLSYTFLFTEPELKARIASNQDFTEIEMKGCIGISESSGAPMIPVKAVTLLIPAYKEVETIKVSGRSSRIENIASPIMPYQNSVPFGDEAEEFVMDSRIYSKDEIFPGYLKDDYKISYSHGYKILNINLNPVQYNPKQACIDHYSEMTLDIKLKDSSEMNIFYRGNNEDREWVENFVINPDITDTYPSDAPIFSYPGGLCNPSDDYDYVIITTTQGGLDYWDTTSSIPYNWESLMDKHESEDGLSCTLVTIEDINNCDDYENSNPLFDDLQAHIREFCKDAYEDWDTSYILIGGDDEQIPAREMDYQYESNVDSDIYWSNLDNDFNSNQDYYWGEAGDSGFDLYSELFIGRLTCDGPQDVSNWMTKSFKYADSFDEDYLKMASFYGGDTTWQCQGDDFMDYSAIQGTDDWLGPDPDYDGPFPTWAGFQYGFETWNSENPENQYDLSEKWTAEPPNTGWNGGSESAAINGLRTAIDNNLALISGIAHANADMSLDVYYDSWESNYHNTLPFFMHDFGCHCGDMDAGHSGDGVLHSMLFHSDTELAFGVTYNTCYGWGNFYCTNSSSAFQAKEFWSYFLDLEDKSGNLNNWQLGKAHAFSKDRMAPTIDWDYQYGTWRSIIQGCLLFADPAQMIKTPHPSEPPYDPDAPDGPSAWVKNQECSFTASTTDPEGDTIYYMFDWGDGSYSQWLGPIGSGQEIEGTHIWTELGDYDLKVRARDVWGRVSEWSAPLTLTIMENQKPSPPTINGPNIVRPRKLQTFQFTSVDPEGREIYYYVIWGNGHVTDYEGPFSSGQTAEFSNSWSSAGEYTIISKAMDEFGAKSTQNELKINVLKSRGRNINLFLQRLIENFGEFFPNLVRLLD